MPGKFRLEGDLQANLANFDDVARKAILASANFITPQAISYMRDNAPWTDRTGAARNGLQGKVQVNGNKVAVVLYHTVHYGVYLENRWGGKYAIIRPTVQIFAKRFVETVGKLMLK